MRYFEVARHTAGTLSATAPVKDRRGPHHAATACCSVVTALVCFALCTTPAQGQSTNSTGSDSAVPMWLPAAIAGVLLLSFLAKEYGLLGSARKADDSSSESEDEPEPKSKKRQ